MNFFDFTLHRLLGHSSSSINGEGEANVFGANHFIPVDGLCAQARVQQMCPSLSGQLPSEKVSLLRTISLLGFCSTHLSRKPSGYRNLSARHAPQTLPRRLPQPNSPQHFSRGQRETRLAHLRRLRAGADSPSQAFVCWRRLRHLSSADRLCFRLHNDRPLPQLVSLGPFSQTQSGGQGSYPDGSTGKHPLLYPHYSWQSARYQHPRPIDSRARFFLHYGPRLHRFCSPLYIYAKLIIFHYPGQEQSRLHSKIVPRGRQNNRTAQRSDHCPSRPPNIPGVSRSFATHQLLRFRKPQPSRFSYEQFFSSSPDHCSALQISLAGGTLFQMDQATFTDQGLFRHIPERCENPNLDCHQRLCSCGHRQKRTQSRTKSQRNFANPQHYIIREKPHI
jgi:hypothetical protein